jgi:hypothetical protein
MAASRRIPPKATSTPGHFWSRKNGRILVPVESMLEFNFCVNLELDESVASFVSQPAPKIAFWRGRLKCYAFPDFLVRFVPRLDRLPAIVDVLREERLVKKWVHLKPRLRAACGYARANAMTYHLRTQRKILTPFFYNARRLLRYLREEPDPRFEAVFLGALSNLRIASFQQLLDECYCDSAEKAEALTTLWILIAHRKIWCDLNLPIDDSNFTLSLKSGSIDEKIA